MPSVFKYNGNEIIDSSGKVTATAMNSSGDAPVYACRAWVNFDGTKDTSGASSTDTTNRLIRASGNVASVLRNGTGDYTITFTTPMPHANFVASGMVAENFTSGGRSDRVVQPIRETMVVGSFRVGSWAHSTGNLIDCAGLLIMVVA